MKSAFQDLPLELLSTLRGPDDISILIGENGSGKSTLLNDLSKHFLRNGESVVAIANSVHDKFDSVHGNFKTLRGRSGRRQTRDILKRALQTMAKDNSNTIRRLNSATRALKYVDFDPVFGFRIEGLTPYFKDLIQDSNLSSYDKERLNFLLDGTNREMQSDEIIWLHIGEYSFSDVQKSTLIELFIWESKLRKLKAINRIEVYLRRKGREISMLNASSGELALITSIIYLSTIINERTVILIDEPENSLHPKWQKEYVQTLFDIFYYYQPKIIIATHSPLILNGAELFTDNPQVYKSFNFTLELQKKEPLNLEETYFRFFNITTPQNRFLSEQIVRLLNILAGKKITLDNFNNEISRIESNSYDPTQLTALEEIKEIAALIANKTNNEN